MLGDDDGDARGGVREALRADAGTIGEDEAQCELCHVRSVRREPKPDRLRGLASVRTLVHRGSIPESKALSKQFFVSSSLCHEVNS